MWTCGVSFLEKGRVSAGVVLHERGYREAARYLSPPYVDDHLVALPEARVQRDERQRDPGAQGRRVRARAGHAHVSTAGPDRLSRAQDPTARDLEGVDTSRRARLLPADQLLPAPERGLVPADRPAAAGLERAELRRSEEHTSELQSRFDAVCRL